MNRILIIDDDEELCDLVSEYLTVEGFQTETAHDGEAGLQKALSGAFDLVTLDVMLPKKNGFDVLRDLRETSKIPVLMLTARGEDMERIVGLEIGADDYLPKTFSTRELLARLRAVTRRTQMSAAKTVNESETLSVGDIAINQATREVKKDNQPIILTALEFDLFVCLARAKGRVLDRDKILDEIAGREYDVFDRSIDVHISSLRRKLGDDSKNPRYIKTIRSVGYMVVESE